MAVLHSAADGYVGVVIAMLFFGSNYVVMKPFPMGDGMASQWWMSIGILITGYIVMFISGEFVFVYSGLLGGSMWALGNLMVPTVIQCIGLGLGLLLWSVGNLLFGFMIGKFGFYGLDKEHVKYPAMNWVGFCCGLLALGIYFFIKPSVDDAASPAAAAGEQQLLKGDEPAATAAASLSVQHDGREDLSALPPSKRYLKLAVSALRNKRLLGIAMALAAGVLFGNCLVPFQLWYEKQHNVSPLAFMLSQVTGIFFFSTAAFFFYALLSGNRPQLYPQSILPGVVSGAMWCVAQAAWLVANGTLGLTVGYPMVVIGPGIISSLWAVFVFREIRGWRNYVLLSIAIFFNICCVLLVAFSKNGV